MLFFDLFRREPNIRTLQPGEVLFREGDTADGLMYVIVSGRARILVGDLVVEEAATGTILGEMAMIEDAVRSASVVADSECMLAAITRKRFGYLVSEAPHFATEVMRVMATRLRNCDARLKGD